MSSTNSWMTMKSIGRVKRGNLHRTITSWYGKHQRVLQWRTTTNPYEILVSEIMLQQTQVDRVKEKLPLFLRRFPNFTSLSKASKADVIRAWRGMGYNNRAVRLNDLAKIIVTNFNSQLPSNIDTLLTLPGIGPYTSHALACFAFRKRVPVVDVNIKRVLSRLMWKPTGVSPCTESEMWELAQLLLPKNAYIWNQALMDLGATVCTARKPLCSVCPARRFCLSRNLEKSFHGRLKNKKVTPPEPSYNGLPRRIWRGKIIQILRDAHLNKALPVSFLRKAVHLRKKDEAWLLTVIRFLEHDGLVRTKKTSSATYVSLAA